MSSAKRNLDKLISASLWPAVTSYGFFAANFCGQIVLARILLCEWHDVRRMMARVMGSFFNRSAPGAVQE